MIPLFVKAEAYAHPGTVSWWSVFDLMREQDAHFESLRKLIYTFNKAPSSYDNLTLNDIDAARVALERWKNLDLGELFISVEDASRVYYSDFTIATQTGANLATMRVVRRNLYPVLTETSAQSIGLFDQEANIEYELLSCSGFKTYYFDHDGNILKTDDPDEYSAKITFSLGILNEDITQVVCYAGNNVQTTYSVDPEDPVILITSSRPTLEPTDSIVIDHDILIEFDNLSRPYIWSSNTQFIVR